MKWYEFSRDTGDGAFGVFRFRTKEEANAARQKAEESVYFQQDGDGSPVREVDTDSPYFFSTLEDWTS